MTDDYQLRFQRVLEHIDTHLDEDLSTERLSGVAAFSKFHFHRQFSKLLGISVFKYVQLVRLRRASYQLAFGDRERVLDIALTHGYESHEAFSRAFKKVVEQTPSEFREQPRWEAWHAIYQPVRELRSKYMKPTYHPEAVKIVEFPETRIAALTHRGDPANLGQTVRKFIEWRRQNRLPPSHATFNIWHDDPNDTPAADFRADLCVACDAPIAANTLGVAAKVIPGGRCAVLRHVGSDDSLEDALKFLYGTWLPESGEELRDFPLFFQRLHVGMEVPDHEAELDIFLPLR